MPRKSKKKLKKTVPKKHQSKKAMKNVKKADKGEKITSKKPLKSDKKFIKKIENAHKKRASKTTKRAIHSKRALKRHAKRVHIKKEKEYIKTGIKGFDDIFEKGIPKGAAVLIAGGAGSGKTIMCLQILHNAVKDGKNCLYMTFEESEERLKEHMADFGWEVEKSGGKFVIKRYSIFDISRTLEAMMAKSEGELLIDVKPLILPSNFKPDIVVVDSLTAIASAFAGKESYRSYIEHLFRYFESLDVNSFLITETKQVPDIYSPTGVEEFLADGVVVLYNKRKGDIRESAIEVLKMRGVKHLKKVVAMRITEKGIEIYPEQEVFGGTD
jgi:circadian clock protein KaiC